MDDNLINQVLSLVNLARQTFALPDLEQLPDGEWVHEKRNPIALALPFAVSIGNLNARIRVTTEAHRLAEVWGTKLIESLDCCRVALPPEIISLLWKIDLGLYDGQVS